jgi:hypothetical protein
MGSLKIGAGCKNIMSIKLTHKIKAYLPAALILLLILSGCAVNDGNGARQAASPGPAIDENAFAEEITTLNEQLMELGTSVDRDEARQVAETAIVYSRTLAARYRVVRPAAWHNILVRMGARERGLCYHWTTDLLRKLQALGLTSFKLYWGVAHRGSELREHNSVVIAARGQAFEAGLVLDPWRHSGDLYWASVSQDRYPWRELPRKLWF